MSFRVPNAPRPLSAGDHAGLTLLQEKLGAGEHPFGATPAELEAAIHSRFLGSFRNRVRALVAVGQRAPLVPALSGSASGASVPLSADTPAERSGAADGERSAASPAAGSSVAPSEGRLFELPSMRHFDVKAEAA